MTKTPYYHEVAGGPSQVVVRWITAADGVRLRAAAWRGGAEGTVFLFTGRTEYLEKYGATAAELAERGFSTVSVDWRGQGLSDRALNDVLTGHVADFLDYQHDVAALYEYAVELDLPRPFFMVAHSMGGAIGLRALHHGLDVSAVAFSAPMWGIGMSRMTRPIAWSVSWLGRALGHGYRYTPGTSAAPYVAETGFDANLLTTDREMFEYMQRQTQAHPELSLGGPSLTWLFAALRETRTLRSMPPPDYCALAAIGSEEAIIDPEAVRSVMRRWPGGRLDIFDHAKHELLMERPEIRLRFIDAATAHFRKQGRSAAA